jgi:hypothetical protein
MTPHWEGHDTGVEMAPSCVHSSNHSHATVEMDALPAPLDGSRNFVVQWSALFHILDIPDSMAGPEVTFSD